MLLSTLKTLQQQWVDSREQADRLVATMEQHCVAEHQANTACETAVQKRLDLEEPYKSSCAALFALAAMLAMMVQTLPPRTAVGTLANRK